MCSHIKYVERRVGGVVTFRNVALRFSRVTTQMSREAVGGAVPASRVNRTSRTGRRACPSRSSKALPRPSLQLIGLEPPTRWRMGCGSSKVLPKPPPAPSKWVPWRSGSKWDKLGCSALKAALKNTVLPDAAYLAQLADEGGVLPRNQDLPPGSSVTLADMEKWPDANTVGALIISYPW